MRLFAHDLWTSEVVCPGKPVFTHRVVARRHAFPDHALTLHQIDVLNRDRAAIAEVHDQHRKADRGFRRGHREHQ